MELKVGKVMEMFNNIVMMNRWMVKCVRKVMSWV